MRGPQQPGVLVAGLAAQGLDGLTGGHLLIGAHGVDHVFVQLQNLPAQDGSEVAHSPETSQSVACMSVWDGCQPFTIDPSAASMQR
jgi:hypothetical protein